MYLRPGTPHQLAAGWRHSFLCLRSQPGSAADAELSRLEPAAVTTPIRQKAWGLRQGLMFLGSMVVGGGESRLAAIFRWSPCLPLKRQKFPKRALKELQPADAWFYWNVIRLGMPAMRRPKLPSWSRGAIRRSRRACCLGCDRRGGRDRDVWLPGAAAGFVPRRPETEA